MPRTFYIKLPEHFNFRTTVYGHGWCDLAPFELDEENWRLRYVFTVDGRAVPAALSERGGRLRIDTAVDVDNKAKLITDVRHILRIDEDLEDFYAAVAPHSRFEWIGRTGAGRLLRSPTVWEDLVKTICTTNCSWGLTKIMVTNLVEKLGTPGPPAAGPHANNAFPTPEQMAAVPPDLYRTEIKAGYRSPYFLELAESVAAGKVDPQSWLTSGLPTEELRKEMKKVKGVGDYAADNLLKLVGRYDGLALDSWLRSQFYKTHNRSKVCPDKKIERHYKKFGKWRGLAIWCDMTENWHI